jgi:hypothetical protein
MGGHHVGLERAVGFGTAQCEVVSVVHALGMVHHFFDEPVAELGLNVKRLQRGVTKYLKEKGRK